MEEKKIGWGFKITKTEGSLTFAERSLTGKKVVIYEGDKLSDEDKMKLISMWIKEEIQPFHYKGDKFFDLIFEDSLESL